jgi:Copper amine oxidase N-terminal domain/WXXGXW repeat (2 copies)
MKSTIRSEYLTASIGALAMFALTTLAANADVGVTVNGSAVDISPPPIVQAGRVFVPLRGVFEQLGASVVYSNGAINATGNGRDISLLIGSTQATVNGQTQIIDVAPFIVGESTYVPLRFISEALGDSVSWDDADSIAAIDTGGGPADYYSPGTASYVDTAPPPIPVYDQPYVPDPNYIWQPGYWAWGSYGYYWIPGTWVPAPQPGYLWTPGYWQGNDVGFHWNPGYWALAVGFYGGVNYGGGYYGNGYDGGQWSNNVFRYNSYVSRVNTTNIRNVYVDRNVYANNSTARIGYNGGKYGLQTRSTPQQLSVAKQRHLGMTPVQQQHVQLAEQDRQLLASVNHNKPPVLAEGCDPTVLRLL